MIDTPFAPWPSFTEEEADAVRRVLLYNRVNYWTGEECRAFEREFASFSGARHAVAVASGSVALELGLQALGIGAGDEVVVTPRSFFASAACIVRAGARPVFADVDPDSQNITAETVEVVLTPRTRAVVCVHLAGWPCEMDALTELAREHGLSLLEDCAQAHGARYRGRSVGALGDIAAWSFCQDKIMSTGGEGGMITTSDEALQSRAWSLKDHGKRPPVAAEGANPPAPDRPNESFGGNGRMTEMQAIIGRIQLGRMPEWHRRRLEIARAIWSAASALPGLRVPEIPAHIEHAAYRCYVFVRPEALRAGWDRDRVMAEINALGVPCYAGSCGEIYREPAFEGTGFRPAKRLPNARALGETSLAFLCHPTLTGEQVARTCEVLGEVMGVAMPRGSR